MPKPATRIFCPDCWKPYARQHALEAHRGSQRCREWREVRANLEQIQRDNLAYILVGSEMLILQEAGIDAARKLCAYTRTKFSADAWGYFVPRWAIDACRVFWKAQYSREEIIRLLRLGPQNDEFTQQLAFAVLKNK